MRIIELLALLTVASCLTGNQAWAQVTSGATSTPTVQATKPAAGHAAAELAGRPDAWRYYWHNGQWWYFTSQNTWLRWNGTVWVQHYSINDSGAFSPNNVQQPTAGAAAAGNDNGANPGPAYRYDINRRKGGL